MNLRMDFLNTSVYRRIPIMFKVVFIYITIPSIVLLHAAKAADAGNRTHHHSHSYQSTGIDIMNKRAFVEGVVSVNESNRDAARSWFENAGFAVMTMRAGLLISGTAALFEEKFHTSIDNLKDSRLLTIPAPLQGVVENISLPQVPDYTNSPKEE